MGGSRHTVCVVASALLVAAAAAQLPACRPLPDAGDEPATGTAPDDGPLPVIDTERNDRPDQAGELGQGGLGRIDRPGDFDIYRLSAVSADRVGVRARRLTVEPRGDGNGRPGRDVSLSVLRSADAVDSAGDATPGTLVVGAEEVLVLVRSVGGREQDYALRVEDLELPELGEEAFEPNDPARPLRLSRSQAIARVAGFYDGEGDLDAVAVPGLSADRPTTVEVAPLEGHRPRLRVLSPTGDELSVVHAERTGMGVGIPNLAPTDRFPTLLLEIADADGQVATRPWTLSLHQPALETLSELEPNDNADDARAIYSHGGRLEVEGVFHHTGDIDNFSVRLLDPMAVTLTLTPDPGVDVVMTWQEAGADPMPIDMAAAGGQEQFCGRHAGSGLHVVEIASRGFDGSFAGYRVTGRLDGGRVENEPNNTPEAPGVFDVDEGSVRGFLASPSDVDVYALRLFGAIGVAGTQRVVVTPPVGVDLSVEVFDDEGSTVVPVEDDAGPGQREAVEVPLGQQVRYYLFVRSGSSGGATCEAPYTLSLED